MKSKPSKILNVLFSFCLIASTISATPVFAAEESQLDGSDVITETTQQLLNELNTIESESTSDWVFDNYPAILDIPPDEQAPDTSEQPSYTEEDILEMEWEQLPVHNVVQINELYDRRTLQIAAYFYTDLQKLLSIDEINEIYDWSDVDTMEEIDDLHIDQYNHLIKYAPVSGYTHKRWKKRLDNGNPYPGYPPTNPDDCNNGKGNGKGCGCGGGKDSDEDHDNGCGNDGKDDDNGGGNGNGSAKAAQNSVKSLSNTGFVDIADLVDTIVPPDDIKYKEIDQKFNYFRSNTDNPVDEMYRAANIVEKDLVLKGKHGLDLVIERRYHSLNAKITQPGVRGEVGSESNKVLNQPYSSNEDIRFATGWSFNIPTYEVSDSYMNDVVEDVSDRDKFYQVFKTEYNYDKHKKRHVFYLDDGTILESTNGEWANHPYNNIYFSGDDNHRTLIRDGIRYDFSKERVGEFPDRVDYQQVIKTNPHGDSILYMIPSSTNDLPIEIKDSAGRVVLLEKNDRGVISKLSVYSDDTRQQLISQIEYKTKKVEFGKNKIVTYSYSTLDEVSKVPVGSDQGSQPKVLSKYEYNQPELTGYAEFNLLKDYRLEKTSENGPVNLDFKGIESKDYVDKDNEERKAILYLLLQKVEYPVEGLNLNYTYSNYFNMSSSELSPTTEPYDNPFNRGVVRLYSDENALSYISYHPVTSVRYSYQAFKRDPKALPTEEKSFIKLYTMDSREVWKVPKFKIERFKGTDQRNGDRIISREALPSFCDEYSCYGQTVEKTFTVDGTEKINLRNAKVTSTVEENSHFNGYQDGKQYGYTDEMYTSYAYQPGKTKPSFTYTFVKPSGELTEEQKEAYDYLFNPEYDKRDDVARLIRKYANETEYRYNEYGDMEYEEDPLGNKTSWNYDTSEREYRPLDHMKKISADRDYSYEESYEYNEDNLVTEQAIEYSYPRLKDDDKIVREFEYDDEILESIEETSYGAQRKELVRELTHDPYGLHVTNMQMPVEVAEGDTSNLAISYEYDRLDRLVSQTYPDGSRVAYTYDLLDRLWKETFIPANGAARTTTYQYDIVARAILKRLPDGLQIVTVYTPFGDVEYQLQFSSDGLRPMVYNTYTYEGRHLSASYPYAQLDLQTQYGYNEDGSLKEVTDSLERTTRYYLANVISDEDSYLPAKAERVTMPNGLETASYYDRYGRLDTVTEEARDRSKERTTRYEYDDFGIVNQKRVWDENSGEVRRWDYQYDLRGSLLSLKDPERNEYEYTYDSLGNLVDVYQNDEHTTHNRYNALSWKLAEDNELDNRTETFAYTTTGDVALYTDKTGNKHKYAYTPYYEIEREDIFSRSGEKLYSKENTYDTNSRQLKTESNSYGHSVSYDYDDFHRTTSFATQGKTYKIRHQANGQTNPYNINDLDDLMDEFTYSNSNDSTIKYRYDALGRLSNLDGLLSGKIQYQYNTDYTGDSVSVSYPNGTSMTQQVNSFGEIIQTSHSDGWLERNNYDGFGNITEVRNNEGVSQYNYDKIDRIEEDASSNRAKDITYEYDELGNRKTVFAGDFTPSTEDRTQKYDALNRLTQVKQGDKTTDYTYYPDGLRASKSDGNDTTQYIYYNGQVVEELDSSGRSKAQNVFGNGLVFRKDGNTGKSGYYLFNSHGDVSKVVDSRSGRVLNQYQYDIWGNPKKDGIFKEEMPNPFRYSGEMLDAETGMYYLRARYYDPSVGRFISEDTYKGQVDNPLTLNRYTYVHNSPLRYVDRTGNAASEINSSGGFGPVSLPGNSFTGAAGKGNPTLTNAQRAAGGNPEAQEIAATGGIRNLAKTEAEIFDDTIEAERNLLLELKRTGKPNQVHHFATNKSKTYTPKFESLVQKYKLGLDQTWNKQLMPHQGRHPNAYHDYVLQQLQKFDVIAKGDQNKFLKLFDGLKKEILDKPKMLTKKYWQNE